MILFIPYKLSKIDACSGLKQSSTFIVLLLHKIYDFRKSIDKVHLFHYVVFAHYGDFAHKSPLMLDEEGQENSSC